MPEGIKNPEAIDIPINNKLLLKKFCVCILKAAGGNFQKGCKVKNEKTTDRSKSHVMDQ